jgi:SAM-dependent methyltransferase
VIYQHPLAYLLGLEGLALLRAWAGDHDQAFVQARLLEVRELLADEELAGHPGVLVEPGATGDAYSQWAPSYDDPGNGLFDLDAPFFAAVCAGLPVGTALDAACGTGRLIPPLLALGHRVLGVDRSPAMLEQAQRRAPDADLAVGDLHRLPVTEAAVDLVVTGLSLTHVDDLVPVLAELARVLRPGGHLVISDVHHELVLRGSAPKAQGPDGQARMATVRRHPVGAFLRAGLAAGFTLRGFDEQPRRAASGSVESAEPTSAPTATPELGPWRGWPWTLLDRVPEAARSAWDQPSVVLFHFQLD